MYSVSEMIEALQELETAYEGWREETNYQEIDVEAEDLLVELGNLIMDQVCPT